MPSRGAAAFAVAALDRGPRDQRLDTAALAAVAERAGGIDGVVAPFAGDVLRAGPHPPVDHQPAADAGAEDDAEHHPRPLPRAAHRLGEREAVGVVLDPHRPADAARPGRPADRGRSGTCVFEFFIRPVRLDTAPGVPMPTAGHSGASANRPSASAPTVVDDVLVAALAARSARGGARSGWPSAIEHHALRSWCPRDRCRCGGRTWVVCGKFGAAGQRSTPSPTGRGQGEGFAPIRTSEPLTGFAQKLPCRLGAVVGC